MRIKELEQYGLDKRTIDYYTNLKMIPYNTKKDSKYRDYDENSVIAIKKIVILKEAGLSVKEIKAALENHSYFTTAMWNKHIDQLKKRMIETQKYYEEMIHYAEELRDSSSLALHFAEDFDNPQESRIYTKVMAYVFNKLHEFINSFFEDAFVDNIKNFQDEDINDLADYVFLFFQKLERLYNKGVSADSSDVQQLLNIMHQRLLKYYGTAVYYMYTLIKDIPLKDFDIPEDEIEDYSLEMEMLGICAQWFKKTKTIEAAADLDAFAIEFADEIRAFDNKVEDSTYDVMAEIIKEICQWPSQISKESVSDIGIMSGFEIGENWIQKESDNSSNLSEEEKAFVNYLFSAISSYIHHLQEESGISHV